MLVDMRCPQCNGILQGREEVADRKTLPKVKECPHCHAKVILNKTPDDLGCISFVFDGPNPFEGAKG